MQHVLVISQVYIEKSHRGQASMSHFEMLQLCGHGSIYFASPMAVLFLITGGRCGEEGGGVGRIFHLSHELFRV